MHIDIGNAEVETLLRQLGNYQHCTLLSGFLPAALPRKT
jgi:hypothetical protein